MREGARLTEVALRSKASWGYSDAFLEAVRDELTFTAEDLDLGPIFVLDLERVSVGFYRLGGQPLQGVLTDPWLEPEFHGRGLGRRLLEHALSTARGLGSRSLEIESDPNAEGFGFYAAMGAVRFSERESQVARTVEPGRTLPLLQVELPTG
jgi:GNAT superfamily N-acetyltransferase